MCIYLCVHLYTYVYDIDILVRTHARTHTHIHITIRTRECMDIYTKTSMRKSCTDVVFAVEQIASAAVASAIVLV